MHSEDRLLVSVVVPCRNEVKHIEQFLDSVLQQEHDGFDIEVLVAEGHSTDGTREVLERYCRHQPELKVVDNPRTIVSTGLNRAIRTSRGGVIVRMDVHTVYAPDFLSQSVRILQRTKAENVGGPARTLGEGIAGRAIAAAYHSPFGCGGARFHDVSHEGPVDTVPYGCWYKATLMEVGLFDEGLIRNQDDELNLRIRKRGGTIYQSPSIVSWYRPRQKLLALFRQYFQYGFWKVAVIRKHRIPASWRHLVPVAFVLANISLPVAFLLARILGAPALAASALLAWTVQSGAYVCGLMLAAAFTARQHGWSLLPMLPLVFATYHVSYGFGFLMGIFHFLPTPPGSAGPGRLFTEITR